jgi:hypothetical protein
MITYIDEPKFPTTFHDIGLPMLSVALNVEMMTMHLKPLLLPLTRVNSPPTVTQARLLDCKPGKRALIRYEVAGLTNGENQVLFGKLFLELSQAIRLEDTMRLLQTNVFAGEARLGVPRPLGCLPNLHMLIYLPVEGQFLDQEISGDQAFHFMNLAGMWLATLHQHSLPLDRQFQIATELVNLQAWAALVGHKYPDQAEAAAQLFSYLQNYANELRLETNVPIHKDFHCGHIVINNRLNVIDFDEMRLGDPNFDLAHFCANLHLLAYRKQNLSLSFSALQSAFLSTYANHTYWTLDMRFGYFYVYTCLKIAKQLCTGHRPSPWPRGEEQHRQVQLILKQGLMAMSHNTAEKLSGEFAPLAMELPSNGRAL